MDPNDHKTRVLTFTSYIPVICEKEIRLVISYRLSGRLAITGRLTICDSMVDTYTEDMMQYISRLSGSNNWSKFTIHENLYIWNIMLIDRINLLLNTTK